MISKAKIAATKMKESPVYKLQNVAIHTARAQLEMQGILDPWSGLDRIREMAAELNLGIRSISRLNIEQRRALIERLIEMGAQVKNPVMYDSDRPAGNVAPFTKTSEEQLRMLDTLAGQVRWCEKDGYLRFCYKVIKAPRPRNSREVTTLRLALESLRSQQNQPFPETMVDSQS
jgi:hypothetical protein